MIPKKIKKLLDFLYEKTNNDEIQWYYNDADSEVTYDAEKYRITIRYKFDYDKELGIYQILYHNNDNLKDYFFQTTEEYKDYDLVSSLYDVAQSSDLDIDLDI